MTVSVPGGFFEARLSGQQNEAFSYWFLTDVPRGSEVTVSVAIGCDDLNDCNYYAGYMDFGGSSAVGATNFLSTVAKQIERFRLGQTHAEKNFEHEMLQEEELEVKEEEQMAEAAANATSEEWFERRRRRRRRRMASASKSRKMSSINITNSLLYSLSKKQFFESSDPIVEAISGKWRAGTVLLSASSSSSSSASVSSLFSLSLFDLLKKISNFQLVQLILIFKMFFLVAMILSIPYVLENFEKKHDIVNGLLQTKTRSRMMSLVKIGALCFFSLLLGFIGIILFGSVFSFFALCIFCFVSFLFTFCKKIPGVWPIAGIVSWYNSALGIVSSIVSGIVSSYNSALLGVILWGSIFGLCFICRNAHHSRTPYSFGLSLYVADNFTIPPEGLFLDGPCKFKNLLDGFLTSYFPHSDSPHFQFQNSPINSILDFVAVILVAVILVPRIIALRWS